MSGFISVKDANGNTVKLAVTQVVVGSDTLLFPKQVVTTYPHHENHNKGMFEWANSFSLNDGDSLSILLNTVNATKNMHIIPNIVGSYRTKVEVIMDNPIGVPTDLQVIGCLNRSDNTPNDSLSTIKTQVNASPIITGTPLWTYEQGEGNKSGLELSGDRQRERILAPATSIGLIITNTSGKNDSRVSCWFTYYYSDDSY